MSLAVLAAHCREIDLRSRRRRLVGVYFLISEAAIVYVGQTTDLESRIELHQWEGIKTFDRAMWIELPADDLSAYEGALIRAIGPKYNDTAPAFRGEDNAVLARLGITLSDERRADLDAQGWRHRRKSLPSSGVGGRIAACRAKSGLTQRDLAKKIGVTGAAVAQWESGLTECSSKRIPDVAAALGVTVGDLFADIAEVSP